VFVSNVSVRLVLMLHPNLALDTKRVTVAPMSRPSSTVSYARNEHLNPALYAASPAPEPALTAHAALSHQEAMERFNVSTLFIYLEITKTLTVLCRRF